MPQRKYINITNQVFAKNNSPIKTRKSPVEEQINNESNNVQSEYEIKKVNIPDYKIVVNHIYEQLYDLADLIIMHNGLNQNWNGELDKRIDLSNIVSCLMEPHNLNNLLIKKQLINGVYKNRISNIIFNRLTGNDKFYSSFMNTQFYNLDYVDFEYGQYQYEYYIKIKVSKKKNNSRISRNKKR